MTTKGKLKPESKAKPRFYSLPELPYGYKSLEPYISERQLKLHHQKHHQAYINSANAILEKLDKARKEGSEIELKSVAKELSFNLGGNELHNIYWQCMAPAGKGGGGEPAEILKETILEEFGTFGRFKKEFSQAAVSCEGSGWAALTYCKWSNRLLIMQVEKHNVNLPPDCPVVMALDAWEHAYYLDYQNERARYVNSFWEIVNWLWIKRRFEEL